jgi:hypothetical protein
MRLLLYDDFRSPVSRLVDMRLGMLDGLPTVYASLHLSLSLFLSLSLSLSPPPPPCFSAQTGVLQ